MVSSKGMIAARTPGSIVLCRLAADPVTTSSKLFPVIVTNYSDSNLRGTPNEGPHASRLGSMWKGIGTEGFKQVAVER